MTSVHVLRAVALRTSLHPKRWWAQGPAAGSTIEERRGLRTLGAFNTWYFGGRPRGLARQMANDARLVKRLEQAHANNVRIARVQLMDLRKQE